MDPLWDHFGTFLRFVYSIFAMGTAHRNQSAPKHVFWSHAFLDFGIDLPVAKLNILNQSGSTWLRSERSNLQRGGMNDPPHPNKSPTDSGPRGPTCRRVIWVWNQGTAMSQQSQFCAVSLVLYRIENDIHSNDHELFILFLSFSPCRVFKP